MNDPSLPPFMPFAILLVATWISAALMVLGAIRLNVLDHPGHRSSHTRPTPKGGGIGITAAFVVAVPIGRHLDGLPVLSVAAFGMIAATTVLAVISWLDDVYQWRAAIKLATQFVAAAILVVTGTRLSGVAGQAGDVVLSVVWVVYVTNAVNFMDGLNGLASGTIMIACLIMACVAPIPAVAVPALVLTAAIAGFIPFNFPSARIFMGDVGSQSCGVLIGAFGLMFAANGSEAGVAVPGTWVPGEWGHGAWASVPLLMSGLLYDVTLTLFRRWRAGARLTESHRDHLYQLATQRGMAPALVTLIHWGFVIWGGVLMVAVLQGWCGPGPALLLVLPPQILWTWLVLIRMRRGTPRNA
ncbi:glycosyltransferase family 4 protein [Gluconacetobacter tumulisoli]|uniref:Glycosyl transferase n=1 Tax=Gluconacetobacter tumulisoli TaxID=1286189 RepID=A0A7W4PKU0_9PROT|nr:glycosyl transferase [Gluconacetobacter tumulisoli]MBB2201787.1 glycosyl transferase [Gluconacetobacter tumulisoli]